LKHIKHQWRTYGGTCKARYRIAASVCRTSKNALCTEKALQIAGQAELVHCAAVRANMRSIFGGHDKVVLMQSLDLLGLQRDRRNETQWQKKPLKFASLNR